MVKIERKELGEGAVNEVTATDLTTEIILDSDEVKNNARRVVYYLSKILLVNGEKQPENWYTQLKPSVYNKFQDAFIELIPYEDRRYTGMLSVEEQRELLKKIKGESDSPKE